jgi:hypothetical protein
LQALRHSKVKLTWDDDDPERNHITRRSLTKKEIEEADFKAYIASSSSESDNDPDPVSKKRSQKNAQRDKLRTLLLAGDDDELPEGWGRDDDAGNHDDVDMEITFTPGLTEAKKPEDETTMEAYQRKMREKRKKRKEEVKAKATTETTSEGGRQSEKKVFLEDDFFEGASGRGSEGESEAENASGSMRLSRTRDVDKPEPRQEMKSDVKAEKKGKKKRGKKKVIDDDDEVQDDFIIDVKDDRFKAIHEDYQFAIDPSNPQLVPVLYFSYDADVFTASRRPKVWWHLLTNELSAKKGVSLKMRQAHDFPRRWMTPASRTSLRASNGKAQRPIRADLGSGVSYSLDLFYILFSVLRWELHTTSARRHNTYSYVISTVIALLVPTLV